MRGLAAVMLVVATVLRAAAGDRRPSPPVEAIAPVPPAENSARTTSRGVTTTSVTIQRRGVHLRSRRKTLHRPRRLRRPPPHGTPHCACAYPGPPPGARRPVHLIGDLDPGRLLTL